MACAAEVARRNGRAARSSLPSLKPFSGAIRRPGADQAKNLAQQSLNAALRAARDNTALLVEEAARCNAGAVRSAVQEGVARLEQANASSRRIATWSLVAAAVALAASIYAILAHALH
jgi:hypothetical protein